MIQPAASDHRILPIKCSPVGIPERLLAEVASACCESAVELPGPRTSKWCVTYLS